jgi:hypothetical protein
MSYTNYDIDIRYKHRVELVGWPSHVPFTSPSHITTGVALRAVREALKSGLCHWVALTKDAREKLVKQVEAGEIAKKARATRADKGVKRAPRGKENIPPPNGGAQSIRSARRKVAVRSIPPSAPFISDEQDEM